MPYRVRAGRDLRVGGVGLPAEVVAAWSRSEMGQGHRSARTHCLEVVVGYHNVSCSGAVSRHLSRVEEEVVSATGSECLKLRLRLEAYLFWFGEPGQLVWIVWSVVRHFKDQWR